MGLLILLIIVRNLLNTKFVNVVNLKLGIENLTIKLFLNICKFLRDKYTYAAKAE